MAKAAVKFELADDETLPLLKFELKAEEKDQIMTDQARRNGLIVKSEDQFRKDVNSSGLNEKIAQNFSNAGSRLTSVDPMSSLNLRDKILTSFSVHDAKTSIIEHRERKLISAFRDSPAKQRYLIPTVSDNQNDGMNSDNSSAIFKNISIKKAKQYAVNTRKMKNEIRKQLPKRFHSISMSYAAFKSEVSEAADAANKDIYDLTIDDQIK